MEVRSCKFRRETRTGGKYCQASKGWSRLKCSSFELSAVDDMVSLVEQRVACRDCAVFAGDNVAMILR